MAMDVTLRQLRAYVAVLEAASFSEAAKAMHLSQAALSGLIKELENRVGVRLLDRTTRKVSASAVGETFAPMARRVLSSLDEALDNLTNLKELRRGLVRVAAPETLSCTLLPELIAGYNNSHPGVDVRFDDVPIQEVLAGLQNGSTDIGFGPAGVVPDQSVEVHMICADPLWVALRSDDPLTKGKSVSWKDLRERPLLNYMPNIAINVLSNVPPRHHPKELVPVHRVNTALSMLRVQTGRRDLPLDGGAAGARLRTDVPAAAAAGRQMEDRDVRSGTAHRSRPPWRAFATSRWISARTGRRRNRAPPHERTAQARVANERAAHSVSSLRTQGPIPRDPSISRSQTLCVPTTVVSC